jgi:Lrp/AsnC family leucine-responsive transcriptional regulator
MNKSKTKSIDRIDKKILKLLQVNGRISNIELSKAIDLSPTPCLERVKRLEESGYIKGYMALLDPKLLEAELLVFVEITLTRNSSDIFNEFNQAVVSLAPILECHLVSGNFDYLIKARVANMEEYRKLLGETLLTLPGVADSRSYIVMEEVKETLSIPIA